MTQGIKKTRIGSLVSIKRLGSSEVADTVFYRIKRDSSLTEEPYECIIHEDHTILFRCLENRIHLLGRSSDDEVAYGVCIDHDLTCYDSSSLILAWEKDLRHDDLHSESELHTYLILLICRKRLDDAFNCLNCIIGMECREYEVSSLSECDGSFDSLEVAHLTDDDDIWVFAEDRSDSVRKCIKLFSEFSLVDEGFFVLVNELYRIFEGDNMSLGIGVDIVEHSRHSCGLTTSCWSCDENDSLILGGVLEESFWKEDILRFWYLVRNCTEGKCHSPEYA